MVWTKNTLLGLLWVGGSAFFPPRATGSSAGPRGDHACPVEVNTKHLKGYYRPFFSLLSKVASMSILHAILFAAKAPLI
jgi:hypothetical protein